MGLFHDECPNCGAKLKKNLNYCSSCGKPLGRGERACAKCGSEILAGANFCPKCGEAAESAPAAIDRRTWRRGGEDFAFRIEISDLPGFFKKDLVVEQGTKALLFQNGKLVETVPAGKYSVENFFTHFRLLNKNNPAHAVVVDAGDVEIRFEFENLFTKNNIPVGVKAGLRLQIDKPDVFFFNVFKGRDRYTLDDVRRRLIDESRNVFQAKIKTETIDGLYGNLELKRDLQEAMETEMRRSLERDGLRVIHFTSFEYIHERFDDLKKREGEGRLDEIEIELQERHLGLKNRIRGMLAKDKTADILTDAEIQKVINEVDKGKILQENEIDEIRQEYRRGREQRDLDHELEKTRKKSSAEREEMKKDREDAMEALARMKEIKAAEERREIENEEKRLQIRSQANVEALLTVLGPGVGRDVLEALTISAQKGLSVEQILAAQAKDHPEVARIFQEKERAVAAERDRLMAQQKESMEKLERQSEKGADRLERLRSIAAGRSAAGPFYSDPPAAYGGGAAAGGKILLCPDCKWECAPNAKFCPQCGTALTHKAK